MPRAPSGQLLSAVIPFDRSFIDFQTGSVLRPNWDKMQWKDVANWVLQVGADALAEKAPMRPGTHDDGFPRLVAPTLDFPEAKDHCVFVCEKTVDFDVARSDDADARLQVTRAKKLFWGVAYGKRPWWFETRDGAKGLVQILGISDNPPGLRIRYRLVEDAAVKRTSQTAQPIETKSAAIADPPPSSSTSPILQMRLVLDAPSEDSEPMDIFQTGKGAGPHETLYVQKKVLLDQTALKAAKVIIDEHTGNPQIEVAFTDTGKQQFTEVTRTNMGQRLAITIGGQLYSAPKIMTKIVDGRVQISGYFSAQEARDLAAKITESLPKQ